MWLLALMSMRANACEALRYQIYVVFPQKRISLYCFSPSKPSKNFVSTYITKTANCVVIERKSVHLKITYVANQRCPMLFQGIIFFPKVIMIKISVDWICVLNHLAVEIWDLNKTQLPGLAVGRKSKPFRLVWLGLTSAWWWHSYIESYDDNEEKLIEHYACFKKWPCCNSYYISAEILTCDF